MNRLIFLLLLIVVAAGAALVWWRYPRPASTTAAPLPPPAIPAAPLLPSAAPTPAARYPVPTSDGAKGLPSLDGSDEYLKNALVELLGRKAVLSFLHLDGFVRDFVATVNNLATDDASAQLWPVNRTPGHFEPELREGSSIIGAANAERYAPFVHFAEDVDTRRAVALYVRLYPLLQSAYEDLGYPGKSFNDRVIQVIDDLLATPTAVAPIKLRRIAVDGAAPATGGLYLFEDPTLEARSVGQKILLRMGRDNASRLIAKLKDLRQQLLAGAARPSRTP